MLVVRKLIWDGWNIQHIARHHVVSDEVETICHNDPVVFRGQKKGRLVVIGITAEKRLLTIILEPKGRGQYYPITAYEADIKDTKLFKRLRGGVKNEKNKK